MSYIFISYSHNDVNFVQKLAGNIEQKGFIVWYSTQIEYGSKWPNILQEKVDNCGAMILIMTSHSYKSEWVQNELHRAQRKQKPVLPLLLEGNEPWLSVEATQYVDVRGGQMPSSGFYQRLSNFVQPQSSLSSADNNYSGQTNVKQDRKEKSDIIIDALGKVRKNVYGEPKRNQKVNLQVGHINVGLIRFPGFSSTMQDVFNPFRNQKGWWASIPVKKNNIFGSRGEFVIPNQKEFINISKLKQELEKMGWKKPVNPEFALQGVLGITNDEKYYKGWKEDIDMQKIAFDLIEANLIFNIEPNEIAIYLI